MAVRGSLRDPGVMEAPCLPEHGPARHDPAPGASCRGATGGSVLFPIIATTLKIKGFVIFKSALWENKVNENKYPVTGDT